jgi:hypothetical protein
MVLLPTITLSTMIDVRESRNFGFSLHFARNEATALTGLLYHARILIGEHITAWEVAFGVIDSAVYQAPCLVGEYLSFAKSGTAYLE